MDIKQRIKEDLDFIWSKHLIEPDDSEDEVIEKFVAGMKEQVEYFKRPAPNNE